MCKVRCTTLIHFTHKEIHKVWQTTYAHNALNIMSNVILKFDSFQFTQEQEQGSLTKYIDNKMEKLLK